MSRLLFEKRNIRPIPINGPIYIGFSNHYHVVSCDSEKTTSFCKFKFLKKRLD